MSWPRAEAGSTPATTTDLLEARRTLLAAALGQRIGYSGSFIKSDDLDLRPVFHRLEERVRAHVLICMLACYLVRHRAAPGPR